MAGTRKQRAARRSPSCRSRDEYTVVLEDLRDQFRAFGEGLKLEWEWGQRRDKKLTDLGKKADSLDVKIGNIDAKVDKVAADLEEVKDEVRLIRRDRMSRQEFELLEKRVQKLEKLAIR